MSSRPNLRMHLVGTFCLCTPIGIVVGAVCLSPRSGSVGWARRAHFPYTLCGIACSSSRSSVYLPESPLIFSFGAFNGGGRSRRSSGVERVVAVSAVALRKTLRVETTARVPLFVLSGTDKGTDDGRWITATRSRIKIGMRSDRRSIWREGGRGRAAAMATDTCCPQSERK